MGRTVCRLMYTWLRLMVEVPLQIMGPSSCSLLGINV